MSKAGGEATLPTLIVITDWSLGEDAVLDAITEVAQALGPKVAFQQRHPEAGATAFLREAQMLSEICEDHGSSLFVNERVDVAMAVGAHVHLPVRAHDVAKVRAVLPGGRWISVAVHDLAEAASRAPGADLALVSPVFGAGSKMDDSRPVLGVEGFERIAAALPCPAFALGGVGVENARVLRGRSAHGFAAISSILRSSSPRDAALAILSAGIVPPL